MLVVFIFLARLLAPGDFGLLALAEVILNLAQVLFDQGFTDAIVQRHVLEQAHLDTAFWINLVIGLLLAVLSVLFASMIASLYKQPLLKPIIRWISISIVLRTFSSVQQAILKRKLRFKYLAIGALLSWTIGGTTGVILAFMNFGVWSLVTMHIVKQATESIILWVVSDWRPGLSISKRHLKELFSFGINILGVRLAQFLNRRVGDLLIGYFLGTVVLGYFSIAFRIFSLANQLLVDSVNAITLPLFSRLQKDCQRLQQTYYMVVQFVTFYAFPAFVGIAVIAPGLMTIVFGTKWIASIPILQILAFLGILYSITYFNGTIIVSVGKPNWRLLLGVIHVVLTLAGFLIAVQFGIVAVTVSYVLIRFLIAPLSFYLVKRFAQIRFVECFHRCLPALIGSTIMAIAVYLIKVLVKWDVKFVTVISILTCTTIYILGMRLLYPKLFKMMIDSIADMLSRSVSKIL